MLISACLNVVGVCVSACVYPELETCVWSRTPWRRCPRGWSLSPTCRDKQEIAALLFHTDRTRPTIKGEKGEESHLVERTKVSSMKLTWMPNTAETGRNKRHIFWKGHLRDVWRAKRRLHWLMRTTSSRLMGSSSMLGLLKVSQKVL